MQSQYQAVTDRIVAMLQAGAAPWHKPWKAGQPPAAMGRPLRIGGQPYRGVNTLNLWAAAQAFGYASPYWLTFKAGKDLGAFVRKGETAQYAFYVGRHTRTDQNEAGEDVEKTFAFLKCYAVFNADQFEDLPARLLATKPAPADDSAALRNARCDAFVKHTGATLRHGGDRAFYSPAHDFVQMPMIGDFDEPANYYSMLLHELTHWTSAKPRLDRQLGRRFGDEAYAAEELVAELGAAYMCADLGMSAEPRADHASYIASWIRVLKNDNRAIFRAAALAERAAGFLHGLQPAAAEDEAGAYGLAA